MFAQPQGTLLPLENQPSTRMNGECTRHEKPNRRDQSALRGRGEGQGRRLSGPRRLDEIDTDGIEACGMNRSTIRREPRTYVLIRVACLEVNWLLREHGNTIISTGMPLSTAVACRSTASEHHSDAMVNCRPNTTGQHWSNTVKPTGEARPCSKAQQNDGQPSTKPASGQRPWSWLAGAGRIAPGTGLIPSAGAQTKVIKPHP